MNRVLQAAGELQDFLVMQNWRFCVIGGLAVLHWGQPRTTLDVDVSLFIPFGEESQHIETLLTRFASRIPEAREFAVENRVLLLSASNGVPLDIALAGFPFEEEMISRATTCELAANVRLTIVSCEDLLVFKAFSGRPQDWADVEGIIRRQAERIDWPPVQERLSALCAIVESTESIDRLNEMRRRVERESGRQGNG